MLIETQIIEKSQVGQQWLGIPAIEITPKGKIVVCWFSGGPCEPAPDNKIYLQTSQNGKEFSCPKVVVEFPGIRRVFDPCLWMTPQGKLWMTYNVSDPVADYNCFEVIECDEPDAEVLTWSRPRKFDFGLPFLFRLNKPTVSSTGRWLIPFTWSKNSLKWPDCLVEEKTKIWTDDNAVKKMRDESGVKWAVDGVNCPGRDWLLKECMMQGVAISDDDGKTWTFKGEVIAPDWAIESQIIEKKSGQLLMWIRTNQGHIWEAVSCDNGDTWGDAHSSGIINPGTKFHITKISDGRWLLLNTPHKTKRGSICAYLSENDGKTWSKPLTLRKELNVSYPDAVEKDGKIYVIYDSNRYKEGQILMSTFDVKDLS